MRPVIFQADRTARRTTAGFSVIELMVVVSILAVLTAMAGPSFVASIERYRVSAIQQELTGSLQLARVEAIRRGVNVILVRTTGCGATLVGVNDWSCGWEVVVDANGNDTKNSGEVVLQTASVSNSYGVIHTPVSAFVRMNVWGQAQGVGHGFVITPATGVASAATTTLCLNAGGRIRKLSGEVTCN